MRKKIVFFLLLAGASWPGLSQITSVSVDLQLIDENYIEVTVTPPASGQDQWTFIIPEIIPGTYMKVNHERYYRRFAAFDTSGNSLKINRKDNFIYIDGKGRSLSRLTYQVRQSLGKGPIWDAMIGCGGSIFTTEGYLLNAQMINGYFEGYEKSPFELTFHKSQPMYGSTSMRTLKRSEATDIFYAPDYYSWVDQPIMYSARFDTTEFWIRNHRFVVATHAELGKVQSRYLTSITEKTMHAVDSFGGFHHEGDYFFLYYHIDYDRLKGPFKGFGVGSALEHKNSSVYLFTDSVHDTTFSYLSHIIAHEYYHTLAPLNLHSEKIRDFSFAKPDMSSHLWLYEGSTDYLATLSNAVYELNTRPFRVDMAYAIEVAENRKERSLTESSREITKSSVFDWISKMLQIMNFYQQGKFLTFAIDVELAERTNGQKRWIDVVRAMKSAYRDIPFADTELREILIRHTYPEFGIFYDTYIEEGKKPDYDRYLGKLGWRYLGKKTKIAAYATKWIVPYDDKTRRFYVHKIGKNVLGIEEGDTLVSINGIAATIENRERYENLFPDLYYPATSDEQIELVVNRNGQELKLSGSATLTRKSPVTKVIPVENPTGKQLKFREMFFGKRGERLEMPAKQ